MEIFPENASTNPYWDGSTPMETSHQFAMTDPYAAGSFTAMLGPLANESGTDGPVARSSVAVECLNKGAADGTSGMLVGDSAPTDEAFEAAMMVPFSSELLGPQVHPFDVLSALMSPPTTYIPHATLASMPPHERPQVPVTELLPIPIYPNPNFSVKAYTYCFCRTCDKRTFQTVFNKPDRPRQGTQQVCRHPTCASYNLPVDRHMTTIACGVCEHRGRRIELNETCQKHRAYCWTHFYFEHNEIYRALNYGKMNPDGPKDIAKKLRGRGREGVVVIDEGGEGGAAGQGGESGHNITGGMAGSVALAADHVEVDSGVSAPPPYSSLPTLPPPPSSPAAQKSTAAKKANKITQERFGDRSVNYYAPESGSSSRSSTITNPAPDLGSLMDFPEWPGFEEMREGEDGVAPDSKNDAELVPERSVSPLPPPLWQAESNGIPTPLSPRRHLKRIRTTSPAHVPARAAASAPIRAPPSKEPEPTGPYFYPGREATFNDNDAMPVVECPCLTVSDFMLIDPMEGYREGVGGGGIEDDDGEEYTSNQETNGFRIRFFDASKMSQNLANGAFSSFTPSTTSHAYHPTRSRGLSPKHRTPHTSSQPPPTTTTEPSESTLITNALQTLERHIATYGPVPDVYAFLQTILVQRDAVLDAQRAEIGKLRWERDQLRGRSGAESGGEGKGIGRLVGGEEEGKVDGNGEVVGEEGMEWDGGSGTMDGEGEEDVEGPLVIPDVMEVGSDADGVGEEVEEESRSQKLFVYPSGAKDAVTVKNDDMARLEGGEYLNDTVIEFWIRYLQHTLLPPTITHKTHIFSTFFFEHLSRRNSGKWDIRSAYNRVANLHWYLVLIYNPGVLIRSGGDEVEEEEGKGWPENGMDMNLPSGASDYYDNDLVEEAGWEGDGACMRGPRRSVRLRASVAQARRKSEPVSVSSGVEGLGRRWGDGGIEDGSYLNGRAVKRPRARRSVGGHDGERDGERVRESESEGVDEVEEDLKRCYIIVFDSLGGMQLMHSPAVTKIRSYLIHHAQTLHPTHLIAPAKQLHHHIRSMTARVPKQNNLVDCGVFLLHYLETFMGDPQRFLRVIFGVGRGGGDEGVWGCVEGKRGVLRGVMKGLVGEWEQKEGRKGAEGGGGCCWADG
ncbi:hypothetical protein HDV00_003654 [Rhizophlyctis rosea]|nr:hypothetical protein HDV00_003654 [Rhizophlyctis rosea]